MMPYCQQNKHILNLSEGVSAFGTAIFTFTAGFYVLKITGSATSYALTLCMNLIAVILMTPLASQIVDFFDKKKLLLCCDILSGSLLLLLSIPMFFQTHASYVHLLYGITFILNLISNLYNVTLESSKQFFVEKEHLLSLNTTQKILEAASGTVAPVFAGLIFSLFPLPFFFLIDGISFYFSAYCKMHIHPLQTTDSIVRPSLLKSSMPSMHFFAHTKEGILYILQNALLRKLFFILFYYNIFLAFSITVAVPYFITHTLQLSSQILGFSEAFFTSGIILGAVYIRKFLNKHSISFWILASCFLTALCMLGFFCIQFLPIANTLFHIRHFYPVLCIYVLMLFLGFFISMIDIPLFMELQLQIPVSMQGRVFSQGLCFLKLFTPLALLLSGFLLNLGLQYLLFLIGSLGVTIFSLWELKRSS